MQLKISLEFDVLYKDRSFNFQEDRSPRCFQFLRRFGSDEDDLVWKESLVPN